MATRRMKNFLIVFSLLLLFTSGRLYATHSMGADLTYTCLGNNTYSLRVSFYRDCAGISALTSVPISISSASCNQFFSVYIDAIPGTGQEITPICPSQLSTCNGGTFTGIQEYIYEGTITLPAQCSDWTFVYEECCRNGAITNVYSPLSEEIYIFSTLNNQINPCNNSPTFSNKPVPFVCLGQTFCFNHGAFDVDGDSLAYSLIDPLSYSGVPVIYNTPFSPQQPLTSSPSMSFDPVSGDFCLTPQNLEVTVMAVLVSEYRNGILIGQVERDIQVTVINCNNIIPSLTGINGTPNFTATICADQQFCFDIFSADPDAGQTLTVDWDYSLAGATFNTSTASRPTGSFCWTPGQSDVSTVPHCFTVQVTDDACPYFGSQTYSYCITVTNVEVDAGPDQLISCSNTTTIFATSTPGSSVQWNNGVNTVSQNVGPGIYIATATLGQCTSTDTVIISATSGPVASFTNISNCSLSIQFNDQSSGGGPISQYLWDFGDGNSSTLQSPLHNYSASGTYNVCLTVTGNNCTNTFCSSVIAGAAPVAQFTMPSSVCLGSSVTLTNTSNQSFNFNWDLGNGNTTTQINPIINYSVPGNYLVTLTATNSSGCTDTMQQTITVNPVPDAQFTFISNCSGNADFFSNGNSFSQWDWNFGNGQNSQLQNPSFIFPVSGSYPVTLIISENGCSDTVTQNVNIGSGLIVSAGSPQSICSGQTATLNASGGTTYLWSDGSTTSQIVVSPNMTSDYTVTVSDGSGCTSSATVTVTVNSPPSISLQNVSACAGSNLILNAGSAASAYLWNTGATTSAINISSPGIYSVTITDVNGCTSSSSGQAVFYPPPVITATNDTSICGGGTVSLSATGIGNFLWSTGASGSSIIVSPATTTVYTVELTDANGCIASETISVFVSNNLPVSLPDLNVCPGSSVSLDAGYVGYNYLWSTGETTQTISVNTTGNYSVTVTNSSGCSGNASSNITVFPSSIIPNITTYATCDGNIQTLDAGNPGNIYLWSTGETSQTIQSGNAGIYSVTVTDANNCSLNYTQTLIIDPVPVASFTSNSICIGQTEFFNDHSVISSGNVSSYSWNFGDGNYSSDIDPQHLYLTPGSYNVQLTVTSSQGCVDDTIMPVSIYAIPDANFSATNVCLNDTTRFIDLSNLNGTSVNNLTWAFGDGNLSQLGNPSHLYPNAGIYTASLILTTTDGCTDTAVTAVTVNSLPSVDLGPDRIICSGEQIAISTAALNNSTYDWLPDISSTNSYSAVMNNSTSHPDTLIYNLTITDVNGCRANDAVIIVVKNVPALSISQNDPQCLTNNAFNFSLDQSGPGYTYSWSFDTSATVLNSSDPFVGGIHFSTAGAHTVLMDYSYQGCPGPQLSSTVQINQSPEPQITHSMLEGCIPFTANFSASHDSTTSVSWWTDTVVSNESSFELTFNTPGIYSLYCTAVNTSGCTSLTEIGSRITVHDLPEAKFTPDSQVISISTPTAFFTNYSNDAIWQSWDFGDGITSNTYDGFHQYSDTGTYDIMLVTMNHFGCIDTAVGKIIIDAGFSFFVPNAFTPNGDGDNDFFQGYGAFINSYEMWIYDRWGLNLYYTNEYDKPWDGKMNRETQSDVFIYKIRVTNFKDEPQVYIGTATLVR